MVHAVIMAGGVGSRFWPRSRTHLPKQFLPILSEATLIQNTAARLQGLVEPQHLWAVTNERHRTAILDQLPIIDPARVLIEPMGRNTAPAIGLAARHLLAADPDAVMLVLPSDHLITDVRSFHRVCRVAIDVAVETGGLVTLGLAPDRPETGYGYIQLDEHAPHARHRDEAFRVRTFAEKPDRVTAERFIHSGDFLWNSGMFIWRADAILREIARQLPALDRALDDIAPHIGTDGYDAALRAAYAVTPEVSIDYGVMERADQVWVVRCELGWSDVGSWDEVANRSEMSDGHGNHIHGDVILHDVTNSHIQTERVVAAIGIDNLIVIDTPDALLICRRGHSQQVKEVVQALKTRHPALL